MNNTLGLENCMVEILRPKTKKLFIFCAYRAPNILLKTTSPNWKTSSTNFQTTASLSCWVTLTLTFNSKNNRSPFNWLQTRLLNNLSSCQLHLDQLITEPTRITETSQTTIDLIFVNNTQKIVRSGVIPCALSDHSLVFCVFNKAGVTKAPPRILNTALTNATIKSLFCKILEITIGLLQ